MNMLLYATKFVLICHSGNRQLTHMISVAAAHICHYGSHRQHGKQMDVAVSKGNIQGQ